MLLSSALFISCDKDEPEEPEQPEIIDTSEKGLYVGIIGFNDELHSNTVKLLDEQSKTQMTTFIDNLTMSNGTILYHAVNTALDKIETITAPEDLVNVSIITFTDGLDQGSYMMNDEYNSGDAYLNAVNNRIHNTTVGTVPVEAYAIGVKGSDVSDAITFRRNLDKLSSSTDNVYEVESMDEVEGIFSNIAENLYAESTTYNVTLKLPAPEPGTRIRFTFDDVENAEESNMYIQAMYTRENNQGILYEIEYVGIQDCGVAIYGTSTGIFDEFTFVNLVTPEGEEISAENVKQWNWIQSVSTWQNNSEFTPSGNSITTQEFRSAVIMLVLDCSSSLSGDFANVKEAAKEFIERLNGSTNQDED